VLTVCCPEYSINPESNLGGEVFERELLKHLALQGVRLRVLLPEHLPHDTVENLEVVPVGSGPLYRFSSGISFTANIVSTFRRERFDLLRSFTQRAILASCQLARRIVRVPVVAHIHHVEGHEKFLGIPLRAWISGVDAVTTVSNASQRAICETLHLPEELVYTIPCGVDHEQYRPLSMPKELLLKYRPSTGLVFGFVGNLIARKVSSLIELFSEIHRSLPDSSLLVCGRGPCEKSLKQTATRVGLRESVRFTGFLSEKEKICALNAIDVFFFPSTLEGFGMAPAEAMLVEKPVLASNRGSLPEVIPHGLAGFVLPLEEPGAWVRHAVLLADADLRRRMGSAGREFVSSRFTWADAARRTKDLYLDLVQRKRHSN
jgi:glycosyltransferase involved in cell wall biosynthesis